MSEILLVERRGKVLILTMNRPEARNAVNAEMASAIERAIDVLEDDESLWAAVLTGVGPVFCAGADLKAVSRGEGTGLMTARGHFAGFVRRERSKPVVVALNGDAVAGGMEIAIAADLIVAGEGTRLGIPEVKRSLLAVGGALANLPRLIGEKAALELALTGASWPAERFVALGLVSAVVPKEKVLDAALELAEAISRNPPLAVRAARRSVLGGRDLAEEDRWQLAEREAAALATTEDFAEGPRAFIEKREPVWRGR
jgi:enoyl-CoA hydratase